MGTSYSRYKNQTKHVKQQAAQQVAPPVSYQEGWVDDYSSGTRTLFVKGVPIKFTKIQTPKKKKEQKPKGTQRSDYAAERDAKGGWDE